MANVKKFDAIAKVGEYEQAGEKKARWQKCGIVFEDEKGRLSLKLECIPLGQEWNGWISLMPPKEGANGYSQTPAKPSEKAQDKPKNDKPSAAASSVADGAKDDDEVPF